MKTVVYKHYLILPDESDWDEYFKDESMVADFKEVKYFLQRLNKYYNREDNKYYYLYAITDNKELSNIFSYSHDDKLFKVIKGKMDKDQLSALLKENEYAELMYFPIEDTEDTRLLLTEGEYNQLEDAESEWLTLELADKSYNEYSFFKDKYIKALDFLMYCTINRMNGPDSDYYLYQMSYSISAEGYVNTASYKTNFVSVYAKLFRLLLRKET